MKAVIGDKRCLLLTDRIDRLYFSGKDVAEGLLIVTDGGKTYFTDSRYYYAAKNAFTDGGVDVKLLTESAVREFFKENKFKTVYLNFEKTTVREFERYKSFGKKVKDCFSYISSLRAVKTDVERERIKKACAITEKCFYDSLKYLKEGVTEKEYREKLVSLFIKSGAEKESFDTIVAFGAGSAVPHHVSGDTALKKDCVVLVDTGVFFGGYASDFTRTLFFGTPPENFVKAYNAVLKANEIAEENIKAGTLACSADGFARDYFNKIGYGGRFTHSLGHGLGLEIHESPYLSQKSDSVLSENNVFTVEPGLYFDGEFGIRIEDTVAIENGKLVRYFTDDKKLIIL